MGMDDIWPKVAKDTIQGSEHPGIEARALVEVPPGDSGFG